jgi:chorismate mutase
MTLPDVQRPLTMTERRNLKKRLGEITDAIAALDRRALRLLEQRAELRAERERLLRQVYRS